MSYYLTQLSNRMYHDGTAGYHDDFSNASRLMTAFEKRVAEKYDLTEKEIDKLDDRLSSAKDAW